MDQSNIPSSFPPKSESVPQAKPDFFSFEPKPAQPFVSPSPPEPSPAPSSFSPRPAFPSPFSATPVVPPPQPPSYNPLPMPPSGSKMQSPIKKFLFILIGLAVFSGVIFSIIIIFPKLKFFPKKKLLGSKVTLTYWGLFESSSVFQQVIDDYQKEHPGVKINYTQENLKMYRERLQAALARNEGPDIFRIHQSWVPMLGSQLSAVPSNIYDQATFENTFYPSAKETLKYNSQYVAVPLMVDGLSLFYNEDIFKSAGKSPPRTWGELRKVACELTVKDEQGRIRTAGVALGVTSNIDHWSDIFGLMMLQNGADLANPAYCSKGTEEGLGGPTCLGKDTLSFYTLFATDQACSDEVVDKGAVWNSLLPTSTYAFATGTLAMYFGSSWRVFDIKGINDKLNFKIVPVPQLPGGNVAWASYWVEAVSKNSKYQQEAWEFLKYLSSEKVLQKLYQAENTLRLYFGEPYPRVDMADQLKTQPLIGPFVEQAPFAKSWYLSSFTSDNGINKQITKYYEDAVNSVNQGGDPLSALSTAGQGVAQVLRQYGLTK